MELGGVGWELFCIGCDWLDGWTRKPLRLRLSHGLEGLRERSGGEEDQKGTRCSIRMTACDTWVLADDRGWGVGVGGVHVPRGEETCLEKRREEERRRRDVGVLGVHE